jgi:DNA-directed RNA polymerase specialized sigma subunit
MTIKEYLSSTEILNKQIASKLEMKERLKAIAEKTTTSLHTTNVSGSCSNSKLEETIIKIISLEEEINAEIDLYVDTLKAIRDTINTLEDPEERLVLEYRYINHMSWDEVIGNLGFSERKCFMLHKSALKKLEKEIES